MKELKAYIRVSKIDGVIHALKESGATNINIIHVKEVDGDIDPKDAKLSFELVSKYVEVVKLELVCSDADAERYVEAIRKNAYTGSRGDGIIFVTHVEDAVKIRTGESGGSALASSTPLFRYAPNIVHHNRKKDYSDGIEVEK
ncbi:TPA: P-II family nitrogen regulator [Candidatus Poribacteria bacterium]|nr:P-II family nitrogen regulator [Candidatus Poribacteria bacterium]